jgi:hypothetical protein
MYIVRSDSRIKKNVVSVSDSEALDKLRLLQPKRYEYVDPVSHGTDEVYGFLADQVQQVLPDAVDEMEGEVPTIFETANVSSDKTITFTNFDTSKLESNVLIAIAINQTRHDLTVDEIIDDRSVRVHEDLSALSGSLDEHGDVITDTETLTLSVEEYESLEAGKETWVAQKAPESNVIECYEQSKTVYPGSLLFIYGERVSDFKHIEPDAIAVVTTSSVQQIDRIQQQHDAQIADLEAAVASRDQQIDELRSELSDIVSRLESLEA